MARDLAPLGYDVTVFDQDPRAGGMIWSQIPRFRLPLEVIDEEVGYILNLGVTFKQRKVTSMKEIMAEGYDAIFVGSGAPRGRDPPSRRVPCEIRRATEAQSNARGGSRGGDEPTRGEARLHGDFWPGRGGMRHGNGHIRRC